MEIIDNNELNKVLNIIKTSRDIALKKVNEELINMYWQIGKFLYEKSKEYNYGDSYIVSLSK